MSLNLNPTPPPRSYSTHAITKRRYTPEPSAYSPMPPLPSSRCLPPLTGSKVSSLFKPTNLSSIASSASWFLGISEFEYSWIAAYCFCTFPLILQSKMTTRTSRVSKKKTAYPGFSGRNPFDSDSESEPNSVPVRTSSAPPDSNEQSKNSQFGKNVYDGRGTSSSTYMGFSSAKNKYKNDFSDSGGLDNQSVQELESYAVYKAEETTQKVQDCLKIAENIKEDATRTLVNLHQQGEQINRVHLTAANIEHDLSRGEKLLGSLGGIFSKTWKPKKNNRIKGPMLSRDDSFIRKGNHLEQRQKLGLSSPTRVRFNPRERPSETASALEKVEFEKKKQDDGFSDLSTALSQLKEMALDMGAEIERQAPALERFQDDVEEIHYRTVGANRRTQRLLGK